MATATRKAPTETATVRARRSAPGGSSLAFLTYQDNIGTHHWELVDASGHALAHSESFVSQDHAERAARYVREGVSTTDSEPHSIEGLRAVEV